MTDTVPTRPLADVFRVVIRWYAGDNRLHRYRVEQVDAPACQMLVPVCREFPYPWRHPREMVGGRDLSEPTEYCDACPG